MSSGLVTLLLDRGQLGVPDPGLTPYMLRKDATMTRRPRGVLPAGAGAVICIDCGAGARADGKGSPIVLKHADDCPGKDSTGIPPRKVWYLDRSMYEVGKGFRPVIQVEGENGFHMNGDPEKGVEPYYVGHDYATAKRIVDEWNMELGIDPDEARDIVLDAMYPDRKAT